MSAETNYRTEFVAVLSDQPQGGFITRKPSEESLVASDNGRDDVFGFFSQRNPNSRRVSFEDFWTQRRR